MPPHGVRRQLPSRLKERLMALLSTDYTEGKHLVEVTSALVLRNFVNKIQTDSEKVYRMLRLILPLVLITGSIYNFCFQLPLVRSVCSTIWTWISDPITASIAIPANNPLNQDVLQWLVAHGLGQNPRALTVYSGNDNNNRHPQYQYFDDGGQMLMQPEPQTHEFRPLQYIPEFGCYTFRRGLHIFTARRERPEQRSIDPVFGRLPPPGMDNDDPSTPRPLVVTCFPTLHGTAPIQKFLEELRGFSKPQQKNTTTIYRPRWNYNNATWNKGITRPTRTLDSVALEAAKKDVVVADLTTYLSPQCEEWYSARGIPYRRGFLLYGPPGTGKTSFSVAVAGHFKLDLYVLSMSDPKTTDSGLENLFEVMPRRCVVLIEDVDSAGLRREAAKPPEKDTESEKEVRDIIDPFLPLGSPPAGLTLSGLLNVLDGPCSKDGRILLMTSNAPDTLDPALVRPGRCDRKVLFGYAGREVCEKMFKHIYMKTANERAEHEEELTKKYDVEALAQDFASRIPDGPESRITPAEIQGFLMHHRDDPVAAVQGAEEWVRETIDLKERGALVAEFENEVGDKRGKSAATSGSMASSATASTTTGASTRGDKSSSRTSESDDETDATSVSARTAAEEVNDVEGPVPTAESHGPHDAQFKRRRPKGTPPYPLGCCCS